MNILILNHYAGSPDMGMEYRPYYLAQEWIKMGHQVSIISGEYSHLRKKNPNVAKDFQKEIIGGICYYWLKTGRYEGNGIKRACTMLRFCKKTYYKASYIVGEIRPDVVIASSTYPIETFSAQKIAKISKAKLIHEVHDMWPATLIELGGMSKWNPFVLLMQLGEYSAFKHSDHVVSLLQNAEPYMREHGLGENKFEWIPNGIVVEEWKNVRPLSIEHIKRLEEIVKNNKFVVGYFGGHAKSNALDVLIEVAYIMKENENIHFVLVGDGVEKNNLKLQVEQYHLKNITFLNPVDKLTIPALVEFFDCIYMGGAYIDLYRFGMSLNKFYDALMAGKPIVFALEPASNIVEEYHCGISVKPGNPEAIANAILSLYRCDIGRLKAMGENGRTAAIQKYEYGKLARRFMDVINQ